MHACEQLCLKNNTGFMAEAFTNAMLSDFTRLDGGCSGCCDSYRRRFRSTTTLASFLHILRKHTQHPCTFLNTPSSSVSLLRGAKHYARSRPSISSRDERLGAKEDTAPRVCDAHEQLDHFP